MTPGAKKPITGMSMKIDDMAPRYVMANRLPLIVWRIVAESAIPLSASSAKQRKFK
jgi:hypothetical protein